MTRKTVSKFRQRASELPVKMAYNFNKVHQGAQPCMMPMVRVGPRWIPYIIMEHVGSWLTYYKDAYGHGESKMEFYHRHGGGWLLVDLLDALFRGGLDAHVQGY